MIVLQNFGQELWLDSLPPFLSLFLSLSLGLSTKAVVDDICMTVNGDLLRYVQNVDHKLSLIVLVKDII